MHRIVLGLAASLLALIGCGGSVPAMAAEAPEFTHTAADDWINSAPLTLASLRDSVVLIEFWTFDCYNCRNTLPWLKAIHAGRPARIESRERAHARARSKSGCPPMCAPR